MALPDWRKVLSETRAYNRARTGRHDMRPYWRAKAFQEHDGQPEPVVRAHAFASVLEHVDLQIYADDCIYGSRAGFAADGVPDDYQSLTNHFNTRKQRTFQAGWDHTLADYPPLLSQGIGGLLERINRSGQTNDALRGMKIALKGFSRYILRHASMASAESIVWISHQPPRTFHEALQLVWFTHMAFVSEGRYANALGRLDKYLYPFYVKDIESGALNRKNALNLLCHVWAHIEELGEVTNICIGGQTPDGRDATNDLSYLCLEATQHVMSPHTNLSARFHEATPRAFHRAAFECIQTGVGFPAIFNDEVLIPGLVEAGIPLEIARDHCMVGCIETMLAGRQQAWSDSRFNTPLFLLRTLEQFASDPIQDWEQLKVLFSQEISGAIARHAREINSTMARFPVAQYPDPFLSALTRDCIGRGLDINEGGAEYPRFHGIAIMGLANVADSLAAVKKLVLEDKSLPLSNLLTALKQDFQSRETMRQTLLHKAPKYGNGETYVDTIAAWVVKLTAEECLKHKTLDGGRFMAAMAANTTNISAGREVGAMPDGRRAGTPLSDAASPYFGRDLSGPTAFLRSVAMPDYKRVLSGSVINMKFEPDFFQGETGATRFYAMTRYFVQNRIPELQFNFTGKKQLCEAREHPENHGNLVVRVSGFSAYFTRLSVEVQDDIIRRKIHGRTEP